MQTLNYIGCKNKLSSEILRIMKQEVPNFEKAHILDLFSGTGIMSFKFQSECTCVDSNDLEYYSYIICRALKCAFSPKLVELIEACNHLEPMRDGLIFKAYAAKRLFFTKENAHIADAIRVHIESLRNTQTISDNEYMFLLASLITSLDKVANTATVYGAFLKQFKCSAQNPLVLVPIHTCHEVVSGHVYNKKAEELVTENKWDVVYMDPPYNGRQYSANYFVLNYVALYDPAIELTGKTGIIKDRNKSDFCIKRQVEQTFSKLIKDTQARFIFLSYNNEGLLSKETIRAILTSRGAVKLIKIPYTKFKSHRDTSNKKVEEYVWVLEKGSQREYIEIDVK